MSRSATFVVTLRIHGYRAHRRLARTLKTALRRDQLRAIDVREIRDQASPDDLVRTSAILTDNQSS